MANILGEFGLPADWEVWGTAAAGALTAGLAFLAGRRLFAARPAPIPAVAGSSDEDAARDPFEFGSTSEKRAASRRKGSTVEVLIDTGGMTDLPSSATVTDRSLGGLGLNVDRAVPVGVALKVRPRHAPPMTPWIEVEVRSCRPGDGGWQLHCAFRKSPAYGILLLFG